MSTLEYWIGALTLASMRREYHLHARGRIRGIRLVRAGSLLARHLEASRAQRCSQQRKEEQRRECNRLTGWQPSDRFASLTPDQIPVSKGI